MLAPHSPLARHDAEVHTWQLRDVEYEDTHTTRSFECVECGAVRYE